ncbi:helix-turn-helix domain-containing protein [Candidatus Daviesbacteria bacterium]|nr:helix-turn-helix domain-containing protein [Candidatus Daviesbacteria bacterium]
MSKPKKERNLNIPGILIRELLTNSELRMVKQRFLIIKLINQGLSVRKIAEQIGVGTDTVVRMIKKIESNPKIKELIQKNHPSTSKWIFGQVSSKEP